LDDAADLDVHVAVVLEFADFGAVFLEADDGESAGVVGGLGGTDVEEAGSIWKFNYVVDMRGDAYVFVEVLLGLVDGDAGFGGVGGEGCAGEYEDEAEGWAQGHGARMVVLFGGVGCAAEHSGSDLFGFLP
jgi:hypothetical protein